jgi:hypothetical protein
LLNNDLISNVIKSHSANAVEGIIGEIRGLADKHNWTLEEVMDVATLVSNWRDQAVKDTLETTMIVLQQTAKGLK